MADLVYCLINLLFFNIPLLCCYTNLNSLIMCCRFSGDTYLSFGISISLLALVLCSSIEDFFEIFVILSAILVPIKSPVALLFFGYFLF